VVAKDKDLQLCKLVDINISFLEQGAQVLAQMVFQQMAVRLYFLITSVMALFIPFAIKLPL
jgi:hypothetical protein